MSEKHLMERKRQFRIHFAVLRFDTVEIAAEDPKDAAQKAAAAWADCARGQFETGPILHRIDERRTDRLGNRSWEEVPRGAL